MHRDCDMNSQSYLALNAWLQKADQNYIEWVEAKTAYKWLLKRGAGQYCYGFNAALRIVQTECVGVR